MHCHIGKISCIIIHMVVACVDTMMYTAFHASEGLALQILERQAEANTLFNSPGSPITQETERVCANWDKWFGDCNNWWSGCNSAHVLYVPNPFSSQPGMRCTTLSACNAPFQYPLS